MALKLSVPSLASGAIKDLREMILTSEPDASVEIDVNAKTVTVESNASEETFKQMITAAGHTVA